MPFLTQRLLEAVSALFPHENAHRQPIVHAQLLTRRGGRFLIHLFFVERAGRVAIQDQLRVSALARLVTARRPRVVRLAGINVTSVAVSVVRNAISISRAILRDAAVRCAMAGLAMLVCLDGRSPVALVRLVALQKHYFQNDFANKI